MSTRSEFVIMVKPVGSACNMRCSYCYYLPVKGSADEHAIMQDSVLEEVLCQYFAAVGEAGGKVASIIWHGGEPTLAGLSFYRKAVELERRLLPDGMECWNNLQTNGLLLDDEWCDFLAEEHFDVGLSIDGTALVHDARRKDAEGAGTCDRVLASAARLKERGIRPDLLCTVSSVTPPHAVSVYTALRDLDTGWMQFIPIVEHIPEGGLPAGHGVSPEAYGTFLKDVFAAWFFHDLGSCEVQLFSETALALSGGQPSLCTLQPTCGKALVVEKDGSVYSCDHFVRPQYRLGNIMDTAPPETRSGSVSRTVLGSLAWSEQQRRFGETKQTTLTDRCRSCPHLTLCGGGCLKDRISTDGSAPGQYYLCEGLRSFWDYAVPRLRDAMTLSAQNHTSPEIMRILAAKERALYSKTARNDPCPCGSGLKFKHCCLHRVPQ